MMEGLMTMFAQGPAPTFSEVFWTLTVSFILWTGAAYFILRGALLGNRNHAKPRLMLGFCTVLMSLAFFLDLTNIIAGDQRATLVRSTSWVLCISLMATAWTGVKFGRKVEAASKLLEQIAEDHGRGDDGDEE